MIHILWEYRIRPNRRAEFESHYASDGVWAELFRRSSAYQETILIQDVEDSDHYLTIDSWQDLVTYRRFREAVEAEFRALDALCKQFTLEERFIGVFHVK